MYRRSLFLGIGFVFCHITLSLNCIAQRMSCNFEYCSKLWNVKRHPFGEILSTKLAKIDSSNCLSHDPKSIPFLPFRSFIVWKLFDLEILNGISVNIISTLSLPILPSISAQSPNHICATLVHNVFSILSPQSIYYLSTFSWNIHFIHCLSGTKDFGYGIQKLSPPDSVDCPQNDAEHSISPCNRINKQLSRILCR